MSRKSREEAFGRFQSKGTMRENWVGGGQEGGEWWEGRVRMGGRVEGEEGRSVGIM